ncbi:MAG TPA: TorF family putative porin [Allosphingosinicella sp.]|nr:TorF family putative porin [Allosphingosinicella sp.]
MSKFAAFAVALLAATPAAAQDEPPDEALGVPDAAIDVSGEVNLLSDYRFRGVSRSDEDPALQAALLLTHRSGLYVGGRGTTLNGLDSFRLRDPAFRDLGDIELDLYAGYGAALGGGFELDAGVLYYVFTGSDGRTDYAEPYASLSYLIGPVFATAGAKYAPAQRAIGDEEMLYLFGQVDVSVPFQPWSFSVSAGRQDWGRFGGYWNWSLGVEHQLRIPGVPDAALGLRYVDTDLPSASGQDAGLVASIGLRF